MNKDVIRKWIEALRSGEYKQARFVLRNFNNCFCVIGVLCDLHAKEFNRENYWYRRQDFYCYYEPMIVPEIIIRWLGKDARQFDLMYIANLNDQGVSFEKLADHIRDKMKEIDPEFVA